MVAALSETREKKEEGFAGPHIREGGRSSSGEGARCPEDRKRGGGDPKEEGNGLGEARAFSRSIRKILTANCSWAAPKEKEGEGVAYLVKSLFLGPWGRGGRTPSGPVEERGRRTVVWPLSCRPRSRRRGEEFEGHLASCQKGGGKKKELL